MLITTDVCEFMLINGMLGTMRLLVY